MAQYVHIDPSHPDWSALEAPATALRNGELVVFPTETVYGVGAHAEHAQAMARLREVKSRPDDKPCTLHIASRALVDHLAVVSDRAQQLIEVAWPGPLTLVLPTHEGGTVGLRWPDHEVACRLLRAAGVPVAAPSANRSGERAPTTVEAVSPAFCAGVAWIIDGGPCREGRSSTVLDLTRHPARILRDGAVSAEQLRLWGVDIEPASHVLR